MEEEHKWELQPLMAFFGFSYELDPTWRRRGIRDELRQVDNRFSDDFVGLRFHFFLEKQ